MNWSMERNFHLYLYKWALWELYYSLKEIRMKILKNSLLITNELLLFIIGNKKLLGCNFQFTWKELQKSGMKHYP
jgi:hypothetical protein